jgi:hypothetical protein
MSRYWGPWVVVLVVAASLASASVALAGSITNSGDDLRTGWYPNAEISPEVVKGGSFGELWHSPVNGQVYAQPLVTSTPGVGSGETLIAATENNEVYGFDEREVDLGHVTPSGVRARRRIASRSTTHKPPIRDACHVVSGLRLRTWRLSPGPAARARGFRI